MRSLTCLQPTFSAKISATRSKKMSRIVVPAAAAGSPLDPHQASPSGGPDPSKPEYGVPPVGTQDGRYHAGYVIGPNTAKTITSGTGAPVSDNRHSMTLGPRGPVMLEDNHLLEKLQALNREKVPERIVHARGSVALGSFTVTEDISDLTVAKVLQPGTKTDVTVRFSLVTHPSGAPETLRDIRGFATKFYTDEGCVDLERVRGLFGAG